MGRPAAAADSTPAGESIRGDRKLTQAQRIVYAGACRFWGADAPALADEGCAGLIDAPQQNVPPKLRRRLSDFARAALGTYLTDEDAEGADLVFASRYSDMQETLKLLNALNAQELLSPTAFSTSVHNAVPGFATLIQKLRAPHTAISAGADSFAMGLTEAVTRAAFDPERPVTFLFHDAALPAEYLAHAPADGSDFFTLCVSLSARPTATHVHALSVSCCETTADPASSLDNARAFLRLVNRRAPEVRIAGTRRDLLLERTDA